MKVSYKLASGGGYTVLFDEGTGTTVLTEFPPSFQSEIQSELLYASDAQFRAGRGNVRASLPLDIVITYTTEALALAAIRVFAGLMDTKLHLKVESGVEVQYYPNALLTSYQARPIGVSITHSFQFVSDNVTAIAQ